MDTHLAFSIRRSGIREGILIPKFYDPDIEVSLELADSEDFDLVKLQDVLLVPGEGGSRLGHWIRREHYGTGDIPYVRTSDISQWRIRPDFKKGVSEEVYKDFKDKQQIQENDILLVAHGTYLVGTVGIVMPGETRLVLQDHVFRIRTDSNSGVAPELLLALMSTSFVRRQVRARQFSADIIDKIGERHLGIVLAVPRSEGFRSAIVDRVKNLLQEQTSIRNSARSLANSDLRMTRERAESKHSFTVERRTVSHRILIPKYYDPGLEAAIEAATVESKQSWVSLGDLVSKKLLMVGTGVEVGKLAYGTGSIPFIRTSDIAEWEIKRDVKHGISEGIYNQYSQKASTQRGDVLVVRDGTYLLSLTK